MIKGRTLLAAAAAGTLAAAPIVSAGAVSRASEPATGESELAGGGALAFVAVGILAAFIAITVINDNDDDEPVSA